MRMRRPSGFAGFTTLWFGQVLSALGTRMTNFAVSIWVWQQTGSATDLAMLLLFAFGATVILSPIAGALVDRWDRRLTLALSDAGAAVATAVLLILFLTGSVEVWHIYVVNFVVGAFLAFQVPAYSSTITLMMSKGSYARANAMMFAVRSAPVIFAPGLAAAVLSITSIQVVLAADVVSCALGILAVLVVSMPRPSAPGVVELPSLWQDCLYGFRYMRQRPELARFEGMMFAICLFASIGFVLLIPMILARGGSELQLGIVQTIGAVGGVAGVVLLSALKPTPHKMLRMLIAMVVFSVVGRILYGVGETFVLWAVALLAVHFCIPFIDGYAQSIWQEKVEPAAQGRVFGARQFIEDLTVPLAAVIAGPAVDHVLEPWMKDGHGGATLFGWLVGTGSGAGMALVFVVIGVLGTVVAVVGFMMPSLRKIETILPDHDADEPPAEDVPGTSSEGDGAAARPATPALALSLPPDLLARCAGSDATPAMAALTAFVMLLHRYGGEHDLVCWARLGDHDEADAERDAMAGLRPLSVRLTPDPTWADSLLRTVAATAGETAGAGSEEPAVGIVLVERGGRLQGELRYRPGRREHADVERMARDMRTLLDRFDEAPDDHLSNISLLDDAEWRRTVVDCNATTTGYPRSASLPELFAEWADRTPDAPAVLCDGRQLSYRELDRRSSQLAHHLCAIGVGPESLVGLCLRATDQWVVGALATLKAGAAYLPLDPAYPAQRIAEMCRDARPVAVLLSRDELDAMPAGGGRRVLVDELADVLARQPATRPEGEIDADRLAYVMYTSGSTGRPKGVEVTHRNIVRLVRDTNYVDIRPTDTVAQASNISFDAVTFEAWGALLNGARLVRIGIEDLLVADRLRRRLLDDEVDVLFLTTSLARQIAADAPDACASVRHLSFGGEQADEQTVRRLLAACPDTEILNAYGPTEGTTFSTTHRCDVADPAGAVPIGRPVANTTAYVLDACLQPVAPGREGELYVGGDGVARGYLDAPMATAERFVPDPFAAHPGSRLYRTGDLVRQRPDGTIEFVGRADNQVKVRGFRVEPGEVEHALRASGLLRDVLVRSDRDERGETRLVAYVVPDVDRDVDDVRGYARARLPEYLVPSRFVVLAQLPLNANGKVDVSALPAPLRQAAGDRDHVAPRTETERILAAIWCDVLHLEVVGVHDGFFELGGRSLHATRVRSRLSDALGIELPLKLVLEHGTVASLASAADELATSGTAALAMAPPSGAAGPEAGALADLLDEIEREAETDVV
jgi:amino acid adenylation domain-containing protein